MMFRCAQHDKKVILALFSYRVLFVIPSEARDPSLALRVTKNLTGNVIPRRSRGIDSIVMTRKNRSEQALILSVFLRQ